MRYLQFWSRAAAAGFLLFAGLATGLMAAPASARTQPARDVTVRTVPSHLLVDAQGHTLYVFAKDTMNTSTCYGTCAKYWPPLLVGKNVQPAAQISGVSGRFGVTRRKGGKRQVTFDGAPLYRYVGDHKAGDMYGQGLYLNGGFWWAVATNPGASSAATGKAATDKLTVAITSTGGTVWGQVRVHDGATSATCSQATCTYQIPSGTTVQLQEIPSSSATWPFSKWTVASAQGTTTEKGSSLQIAMHGNLTVTAVYVLGSGY